MIYDIQFDLISFLLLCLFMQNGKNGQPTYNVINVWKRNITGEGVVVAVVDEGFDPQHPDLWDNFVIKFSHSSNFPFLFLYSEN